MDDEVIREMTLEDACARISASVYQATAIFERLEAAGLVIGNGHHARQKVAEMAVAELRERWRAKRDSK